MRRAAPYAQEKGVTIALKPHGGLSTTADDTLRAIETVNHPAYRLCFDPGNLLYYAGLRPEVNEDVSEDVSQGISEGVREDGRQLDRLGQSS